jgi:thioesterase domain-containing protein
LRASEAHQEESVNQSELLQDSAWGWSAFSREPVNVQFVPGNHVTMMIQPHVQILGDRLRACINQAQANINNL